MRRDNNALCDPFRHWLSKEYEDYSVINLRWEVKRWTRVSHARATSYLWHFSTKFYRFPFAGPKEHHFLYPPPQIKLPSEWYALLLTGVRSCSRLQRSSCTEQTFMNWLPYIHSNEFWPPPIHQLAGISWESELGTWGILNLTGHVECWRTVRGKFIEECCVQKSVHESLFCTGAFLRQSFHGERTHVRHEAYHSGRNFLWKGY